MRRTLFALLTLIWLTPAALAQPKTEPAPQPVDSGASVYQKVVHSTVWIHSDRPGDKHFTGSGSLVDKGRRLVLTNYHVVGDVKKATVYFPAFDGRKPISERKYYTDRSRLGIPGEVVELDKQADLALIRVDHVPDGVPELPLAKDTPDPGQAVHSIGNPGKSGALWVYTPGKVRQVYTKKWKARLDDRNTVSFEAKVIETDSPTNPGDSGGPLVNDKGELVGVTQGGAVDAQAISIFVALPEVKHLLNRRSVQALRSDAVASADTPKDPPKKEPAKPHRDKPLESKDEAKFFGEETWKKVAPTAAKMLKEKNLDFFIETMPTPPKGGDAKKISAMSANEREKFFKDAAEERVKELKLTGVYLLVCKSPGTFYVVVTHTTPPQFNSNFGDMLRSALLRHFKESKFDEGLQKMIDMTLDELKLGEKK